MSKTIKQLYNHKVKYPGSLSFYEVKVSIGGNARSKKELREKLDEIMPGLSNYLFERGFIVSTNKAMPSVEAPEETTHE